MENPIVLVGWKTRVFLVAFCVVGAWWFASVGFIDAQGVDEWGPQKSKEAWEIEKLRVEIDHLRSPWTRPGTVLNIAGVVAVLVAGGLGWYRKGVQLDAKERELKAAELDRAEEIAKVRAEVDRLQEVATLAGREAQDSARRAQEAELRIEAVLREESRVAESLSDLRAEVMRLENAESALDLVNALVTIVKGERKSRRTVSLPCPSDEQLADHVDQFMPEEVQILTLHDCKGLTNHGLRPLRAFKNVFQITLSGAAELTDDALEFLTSLEELRFLTLDGFGLTGEGLRHVVGPGLTKLSLIGCERLESAGLEGLRVSVEWLYLDDCNRLTGRVLQQVSSPQLKILSLRNCSWLRDEHLAPLANAPELSVLSLDGTGITGEGLKGINSRSLDLTGCESLGADILQIVGEMPDLDTLYMSIWPFLVDSNQAHLHLFENLGTLQLRECTGMTELGIASLREALPACKIVEY